MKNRRQKSIYIAVFVLLSVGLAGSRAGAAPEEVREEKNLDVEKRAGKTAEPTESPEQEVRQKVSRLPEPEKINMWRQSAGEAEQLPSTAAMLAKRGSVIYCQNLLRNHCLNGIMENV